MFQIYKVNNRSDGRINNKLVIATHGSIGNCPLTFPRLDDRCLLDSSALRASVVYPNIPILMQKKIIKDLGAD